MIPSTDPPIKRDDRTPSTLDQANVNGWDSGIYSFGKAESPEVTYFNPSIVERADGLWLLVRRAENVPGSPFGHNAIWAIKLDESGRTPIKGVRLRWQGEIEGQHHEDPRAFYVEQLNQVGVGACTFKWHGQNSWTGAIQTLGFFDQDWNCKIVHYPPLGTNPRRLENIPKERFNKNLVYWHDGKKLRCVYKSDPWTVYEIGDSWQDMKQYVNESARWSYGEIRGGTPPVLVDGRLYVFFHSSVAWRGNYRRYYMGAICFSAEAPFEVLSVTKDPLLIGSQNDPWGHRKPPCVFPGGSVYRDGKWLIVYGVNDLKAGWVEIPHSDVLARLGENPGPAAVLEPPPKEEEIEVISEAVTPKPIKSKRKGKKKPKRIITPELREKLRANIAKARAARAEKLLAVQPFNG